MTAVIPLHSRGLDTALFRFPAQSVDLCPIDLILKASAPCPSRGLGRQVGLATGKSSLCRVRVGDLCCLQSLLKWALQEKDVSASVGIKAGESSFTASISSEVTLKPIVDSLSDDESIGGLGGGGGGGCITKKNVLKGWVR